MDKLFEFTSQHPILILALVTVAALIVFTEIRRATRPFKEVTPGQATRLINDGAVAVDLRQPDAYRKGHVAGAANYPGDRIEAHVDDIRKRIKQARQQPVLVYCDTGMSSGRAATYLAGQELGVEVFALKGGLAAWQRENLPLKK